MKNKTLDNEDLSDIDDFKDCTNLDNSADINNKNLIKENTQTSTQKEKRISNNENEIF